MDSNSNPKFPVQFLPNLLADLSDAEQQFLSGSRDRGKDLESAVRIFLEFLRGFEFFGDTDRPCVTVFGSARFAPGHRYYEMARHLGRCLAQAGYAVMTGGGPGIMEAANCGAKEAGGTQPGMQHHSAQGTECESLSRPRYRDASFFIWAAVDSVVVNCPSFDRSS
jgi:SLOG-like protein